LRWLDIRAKLMTAAVIVVINGRWWMAIHFSPPVGVDADRRFHFEHERGFAGKRRMVR
jgi:hypothetical protein